MGSCRTPSRGYRWKHGARRRVRRLWLSGLGLSALGLVVLVLEAQLLSALEHEPVVAAAGAAPDEAQFVQVVQEAPPPAAVARPMPDTAFKGQKRPPCDAQLEHSIRGGCWVELALPPGEDSCGKAYLYEGHCYLPSAPAPKPSLSVGQ